MRRGALAASMAVTILAATGAALAGPQAPRLQQASLSRRSCHVLPAVVMFNFEILRRHMLDTLIELIDAPPAAPSEPAKPSATTRRAGEARLACPGRVWASRASG